MKEPCADDAASMHRDAIRKSSHLLTAAAAAALVWPVCASAGSAVCTVEAGVLAEPGGRLTSDGSGTATCLGTLGGVRLDPLPAPARVTGTVRQRLGRVPELVDGRVTLLPRRFISFDPDPTVRFAGLWTARSAGPLALLRGEGRAEGRRASFTGEARLTFVGSLGTVRMTLGLRDVG